MFGEYASLQNENERDEIKSYLYMWKKYLIRRLSRETYDVKILDEQWGEKPSGSLMQSIDIYLKIIVEFEWKYDDHLPRLDGMDIKEIDLNHYIKKQS